MSTWSREHGEKVGGKFFIEMPEGTMEFCFVGKNTYGILDHVVKLPNGVKFYNPMRVIKNGAGNELVFTLFHFPGMTDQQFATDAATVEKDLRVLKSLLER